MKVILLPLALGLISAAPGHTLDREARDKYTLLVQATDRGTPSLSAYILVTVNVLDENDNPPIWDPLETTVYIDEEQPIGTLVTGLTVTDADTGANELSVFAIDSSTPANDFQVSSTVSTDPDVNNVIEIQTGSVINMDPMYPPRYPT